MCCSLLLFAWRGQPFSLDPRAGDSNPASELISLFMIKEIDLFPQAHGELDEVVSYKRGQLTAEVVERLSKRHKFITYPNMGHEGTLVSMN